MTENKEMQENATNCRNFCLFIENFTLIVCKLKTLEKCTINIAMDILNKASIAHMLLFL